LGISCSTVPSVFAPSGLGNCDRAFQITGEIVDEEVPDSSHLLDAFEARIVDFEFALAHLFSLSVTNAKHNRG